MKFTKSALRALLVLGLFQQADTQAVTVTITETAGPNVLMGISGSLTAFPAPVSSFGGFSPGFESRVTFPASGFTVVNARAAVSDHDCKYRSDFVVSYTPLH
jgi:hypothetical protein